MVPIEHDRRVDYVEFQTTDIDRAKTFHTTVFGWEFTDYGPGYTSFHDGRLSGGFELATEPSKGGALVVIYAAKLEELEAQVRENGGRISQEIFEFPGGRRFHLVAPGGSELAVWSDRK